MRKIADRALRHHDAKAFFDQTLQIDPTPALDAIDVDIRTSLDDPVKLGQSIGIRQSGATGLRTVQETPRTFDIVAMHPVPQRLTLHAGSVRSLGPLVAVQNRRDRQASTRLSIIPQLPAQKLAVK